MALKSGIKAERQQTSSIPLFMWLLKANSSHSITHYYPIRRPSQTRCCARGPCAATATCMQRTHPGTFEALQPDRRRQSTGPPSLHWSLGHRGDPEGRCVWQEELQQRSNAAMQQRSNAAMQQRGNAATQQCTNAAMQLCAVFVHPDETNRKTWMEPIMDQKDNSWMEDEEKTSVCG